MIAQQQHIPVLADELISLINPSPGQIGVDCTLGCAGHALAILKKCSGSIKLLGIDVDPEAVEVSRDVLKDFAAQVTIMRANFGDIGRVLGDLGLGPVDFLCADLGLSSAQIDSPERGFSFSREGPLDMRMDPALTTRAADLVNGLREQELADLIERYGEEFKSRRIAHLVCQARRTHRIDSTRELADLVVQALGLDPQRLSPGRIHPATKTFQALRIAVNDELGQLERLLRQAPKLLAQGGRFAVISFHSLEDGLVKDDFRTRAEAGVYRALTKKPITAGPSEILRNPRSRSAKLRAVEKTAQSGESGSI